MIKSHETQFAVTLMCRVLSVSKAGYYHWRNRAPSARDEVRERLTQEVKRVFDDEKSRPGALRIANRLTNEGFSTHRKMVANFMKTQGWRAKAAKKYKATTHSNYSLPVVPNLLNQHFEADRPDQK
jgi:putative transposase